MEKVVQINFALNIVAICYWYLILKRYKLYYDFKEICRLKWNNAPLNQISIISKVDEILYYNLILSNDVVVIFIWDILNTGINRKIPHAKFHHNWFNFVDKIT